MKLKHKPIFVLLISAALFGVCFHPKAENANLVTPLPQRSKNVIMPIAGDDFPDDIARQKYIDSTFKNIQASHIFVCETVQSGQPPDWLEPEALVEETKQYISTNPYIEYADHKPHHPDVRECKYDPVLDEPGNLNFIIKVQVGRAPVDSKSIPLALITRTIYRPDHRTSIQALLGSVTFLILLDDEQKARKLEQSKNAYWGIGYSEESQFNK